MEKITFEDATLDVAGKVTIDGTDYPITEAQYTGGTDLNANTFNTMQDNIETAINGVVESGSNENGSWIRFIDGTLICTCSVNETTVQNNSMVDRTLTFPMTFTKVDSVVVSLTTTSTSYEMGSFSISAPIDLVTNNNFVMRFYSHNSGDRMPAATYIAIGKWK